MADCLASHTECREEGDTRWLPSRLLDVSISSNPETVCLRGRDEILSRAKDTEDIAYLTLSHMWGTEKFYTLTNDTFMALQQGVDITELRPLFRDAIALTRRFKVRYLWIDSLWQVSCLEYLHTHRLISYQHSTGLGT